MTQAFPAVWRQLTGSDATLHNAHVVEDYLARTPTMCRIIAVGRIVLYPEPTGIRLGMCGQGVLTSWVHHPMPSSGAGGRTGSRQTCPIVWQCHQVDNEIRQLQKLLDDLVNHANVNRSDVV